MTRGCARSGLRPSIDGGLGWLPDSRRVWFLAEHDGWMQLSTVDATSASPTRTALTTGAFRIDAVRVGPGGDRFYIQSTEASPGERHLYAVAVDDGASTRLTSVPGGHEGVVSPDGEVIGLVSSFASRPPARCS
ncbi:MAG: DPP IV N-terminal domain-containing protein [Vicinamibacterales bacterium]